ncbi:MAG: acetate--CoA ligase [Deltaproteobacteria bacterium]|nr:acetate--CoA ligase [Deltaproteobacteria bacterium]
METEQKWYDVHLDEYRKVAYVNSKEQYEEMYRQSLEDPDTFWAEQAKKHLTWFKEWDFVLREDLYEGNIEWFGGGMLNASYDCLDRHLDKIGNKVAYHWEGDDPEKSEAITYRDLYERVNKLAAFLKSRGINKGDRIIIYMPMILQLPVAMLACARIGAIHSVVFGGFSAESLADRIEDCKPRIIITADGGFRGGRAIPLKANVDKALEGVSEVEAVLIYKHCDLDINVNSDLDVWWHEALAQPDLPDYVEPERMDAEDPLFILYTSGSTGKPKGVLHTHAGYLLQAAMTVRLVFDLKDDEVWWCTADIGWVTGHTYIVYGPLIEGLTSVLFEGVPSYPAFDRFWAVVEKYKVNKFYTAPTAIRAIAKEGAELAQKHDVSTLKLLGTVGEPINPEAWRWYYHYIGRDWCPIMDTWWQTETGSILITPLPGVGPIKPGSCSFPFFGVEPVIMDIETGEPVQYPNQEGALFIKRSWPGIARTLYGDHERFKEVYFSQAPGMYFTGDGAKQDEDGYFWIIGRIDDVINVSGHRLGTAEIESALVLHAEVAEAAVVGFPHKIKGQGIYAFVTLNTGVEPSEELKKELVQLVRKEIGPIANPDVIQWASGLPKTRSGKIMRRILQKIAAGITTDLGDTSTIADPEVLQALIEGRQSLQE